MQELKALLRGDTKWTTMQSDDARAELAALVQIMRSHGFKVVSGEQGERRVINPITGECEVIYKLEGAE